MTVVLIRTGAKDGGGDAENPDIAATGEGGKAPGTEDGTEFLGVLEFETGADDGTVTGTLTGGGGGGAMGASAGAGQGGLMKLW